MAKQRKNDDEYNYDDVDEFLEIIDDDDFFDQFESKQSRRKSKHRRDARRRIEDYWDDRRLAATIDEYHYHPDD